MFKTKIVSFKSIVYDDFADKVLFNIVNEGQVCILTHHVDCAMKLVPSICYIFYQNKKHAFYIGYGFAVMLNNELKITSNLVTSKENYNDECSKLGEYGQICVKNFEKVTL